MKLTLLVVYFMTKKKKKARPLANDWFMDLIETTAYGKSNME